MREPEDLRTDPRYEYMVGRLVGATEMMVNYMALHGDEKARGMAERVNLVTNFFMKDDERHSLPVLKTSEADTLVIPSSAKEKKDGGT